MRKEVFVISLVSILLLVLTVLLEGLLSRLGFAGYLFFRLLYAVVNVYIIVLNPSMMLASRKVEESSTELNGLKTKIFT